MKILLLLLFYCFLEGNIIVSLHPSQAGQRSGRAWWGFAALLRSTSAGQDSCSVRLQKYSYRGETFVRQYNFYILHYKE